MFLRECVTVGTSINIIERVIFSSVGIAPY